MLEQLAPLLTGRKLKKKRQDMATITKSMAVKALKEGKAVYANFKAGTMLLNVNAPTWERMRVVSIGPKYVTTMTAGGKVAIENVASFDLG